MLYINTINFFYNIYRHNNIRFILIIIIIKQNIIEKKSYYIKFFCALHGLPISIYIKGKDQSPF